MELFLASPVWMNVANISDQTKDQDLLSHLLRNLASLASATSEKNVPGLSSASPDLRHTRASGGICIKVRNLI